MGKDYLNRHEFHAELANCKKAGKLSPKAINMFTIFASKVSDDFFFQVPEEKDDAIAMAMHDVWKYWRGFKESCVCRIHMNRNFVPGEFIIIDVHGLGKITLMAGHTQSPEKGIFLVLPKNINKTVENLSAVLKNKNGDHIELFMDNIKKNMTFMDKYNSENLSNRSSITIKHKYHSSLDDILKKVLLVDLPEKDKLKYDGMMKYEMSQLSGVAKNKKEAEKEAVERKYEEKIYISTYDFTEPPNAFGYFTSQIRNGILKSINQYNPAQLRHGKKISIDRTNGEGNGIYNF